MCGIKDPVGGEDKAARKDKIEKRYIHFAKKHNIEVITGHTHRPHFSEDEQYYNTGSCVHPRCITAIEIVGGRKTLVKWSVVTGNDYYLYIKRTVLDGFCN